MEKVEEIRHQTGMKEIYQKRKETIERVFADGKEKHGMRYTQYRGLAKVTMELTLLFACMNLKKLAIWKWRKGGLRKPCSFVWIFEPIYLYIKFKMVPGASHQEPFCLQSEVPKALCSTAFMTGCRQADGNMLPLCGMPDNHGSGAGSEKCCE